MNPQFLIIMHLILPLLVLSQQQAVVQIILLLHRKFT